MLKRYYSGVMVLVSVFFFAAAAWAQPAMDTQDDGDMMEEADYCGNIGTVKAVSAESIVIDGMNWDFESEDETVEETYVIDPSVPPELDGYPMVSDIKEGDFIGVECENTDGKMVVTLIQSEQAINEAFEDVSAEMEEVGEDFGDMQDEPVEDEPIPADTGMKP